MENSFKTFSSLNFAYGENGITGMMTTKQAIAKLRKELIEANKRNLQTIKESIHFIPVSDLIQLSGTDFCGYIGKNFHGNITYDGINGIDDLLAVVETVAAERGITEPCISYIDVNGDRLIITEEYYSESILFLNAEVNISCNYDSDCFSEKGMTIQGFDHPSMKHYYGIEMKQYDHDYALITEMLLYDSCNCGFMDDPFDDKPREELEFDPEKCKGCEFYKWMMNNLSMKGKMVIYIKAI